MPLNLGIIGAGRIGRVHANTLTTGIPAAKVLAIADIFADSAQAAAADYGIPRLYQRSRRTHQQRRDRRYRHLLVNRHPLPLHHRGGAGGQAYLLRKAHRLRPGRD